MIRPLTVVLALWYFFAAATHAGLLPITASAGTAAAIVETALGLVLLASVIGPLRPLIAYVVALAGTLFGFAIVVARGLSGFDLLVHVVMLAGLAIGFALIWRGRTRPT